jgi:hypothetical protein
VNDLVKACVIHLVQPARFKVMLLTVVRPAHRDERVRDERDVIAPAFVGSASNGVDVWRDALTGWELAKQG